MNDKLQAIFDKVGTHLLTQNKRALDTSNGGDRCMYINPEGLKCAAGCLIPEDEYRPEFEHGAILLSGFESMNERTKLVSDYFKSKYSDLEMFLIIKLQKIHDTILPNKWRDHLYSLADNFQLNVLNLPPIV